MAPFPGLPALGRGVVIDPDQRPSSECAGWPQVVVNDQALTAPGPLADQLHRLWLGRQPVVVILAVDPAALRTPERCDLDPWQLDPTFEFARERLQYLVWSNNYDARGTEPIWWHARRAVRLGATLDGRADIRLVDGTDAWCDGGPRQPLAIDKARVVHRESIDTGSLSPDRYQAPSAELASDQMAAVAHPVGPARVIAPAGSGKTRVLTERLRHLLADRGLSPGSVTALAYNKRAADEMARRTTGLGAHIRTLNSLGLAIINGSGPFTSTRADARQVIEEREVRSILESLVEVRRQQNTDPLAAYMEALSVIRLGLISPDGAEEAIPDAVGVAALFDRYRAVLAEKMLVDFDEQIYSAIEVLLAHPQARVANQGVTRHLLVDEFQDLTPAHLLLLRLLAAPTYDVFGVGDDDQVIYSYAGATPEYLINYDTYFPGAVTHPLEVNYRCPPAVVDAAVHLLSYNHRRVPKTIRTDPGRPDDESRGLRIDRTPDGIQARVALGHLHRWHQAGADWSACAVLTRVNSVLLAPQVTLIEAGVPCSAPLGRAILNRTGIRAALAYLRIGVDPGCIARADIAETIRRPGRRIARNVAEMIQKRPTTSVGDIRRLARALSGHDVDRLTAYANDLDTVADAVRTGDSGRALAAIRVDIGLGEAMEVLDASRHEVDRSTHGDDLAALAQVAALHPEVATFEAWLGEVLTKPGAADGVTLSTVHRVKGQEWPYVVVLGADGGSFPHRLATSVEEERRIFHVALTRAATEAVVLADATDPSPFCAEITGMATRRASSSTGDDRRRPSRTPAPASRAAPGSPRSAAKRAPLPATHAAAVGDRLRIRGGIEAVIVDVDDTGAFVTPADSKARVKLRWGDEVEFDRRIVRLMRPGSPSPERAMTALRTWRTETASRDKVPAYVVFSDEYLEGLAMTLPSTLVELARCRGVGPAKLERYGDEILTVLEAAGKWPN